MLSVSNLSIKFQNRKVLQNLSFSVANAGCQTITGPSGCGKTTLLKAICGFVDVFESGEIRFEQTLWQNSSQKLFCERSRPATLLFQELAIWPHLTASDQIELILPKGTKAKPPSTKELIEDLDLASCAHQPGRLLSGGEKKRVALARALRSLPKILALDEPFNGLDSSRRGKALDLLAKLQCKYGFSLIVATHEPQEVAEFGANLLTLP